MQAAHVQEWKGFFARYQPPPWHCCEAPAEEKHRFELTLFWLDSIFPGVRPFPIGKTDKTSQKIGSSKTVPAVK